MGNHQDIWGDIFLFCWFWAPPAGRQHILSNADSSVVGVNVSLKKGWFLKYGLIIFVFFFVPLTIGRYQCTAKIWLGWIVPKVIFIGRKGQIWHIWRQFSVKEKTRESVDSLFRINERVARVDSAITNQHLSSDFYYLKHFAHVDCFKWKLNFKHRYLPMYMYAWY